MKAHFDEALVPENWLVINRTRNHIQAAARRTNQTAQTKFHTRSCHRKRRHCRQRMQRNSLVKAYETRLLS
jgi:hypothetical protein